MRPDIVLQLGDVAFERMEVPEVIPFGGEQALGVYKLAGGTRVIHAMGRDDAPLEWSGIFMGKYASQRAELLDAMRIEGNTHPLSWGRHSYTVIIQSFAPQFQRKYQIPYRISCVVVEDLATASASEVQASLDDQIETDLQATEAKGGLIGDDTLAAMITTVRSAVDEVTSFVSATAQQLQTVLQPVLATQAQVRSVIAELSPVSDAAVGLAAVIPYAPFGNAALSLQQNIDRMAQLDSLYQMDASLGRIATNVSADGVSGKLITMAGGDLYHVAAELYGDASAWPVIARANGLSDPVLTGVQTLTVPAKPSSSPDGVLAS
jgi:prophage DNA circulation protein